MNLSRLIASRSLGMLAGVTLAVTLVAADGSAQPNDNLLTPPLPSNGQPFRAPSPLLAQANTAFSVPPLVERPLGLEEGPRVVVSRFALSGALDRPEFEISLAEIERLMSQHQSVQPPDGYTVNQLQAVADDLTRYYRAHGLILARVYVPAQDVRVFRLSRQEAARAAR